VIPAAYLRFASEKVSEESTEDLLMRIPDIDPVAR
jgi:hypothetical protein